jgi:hypothetical protein
MRTHSSDTIVRVHAKHLNRGPLMKCNEYIMRVEEALQEVKQAVLGEEKEGHIMTREQAKGFKREVSLKIPFVSQMTHALSFEFELFIFKREYIQRFKQQQLRQQASASSSSSLQKRAAGVGEASLRKLPPHKSEVIIARCHAELQLAHLRDMAQAHPEWHDAQEAHANAFIQFLTKEGVTPASRADALTLLRMYA